MPEPEESLDPTRAEEVRRLLADARHADPMPADVVARLDAVLTGLRAAPAAADASPARSAPDVSPDAPHAEPVPADGAAVVSLAARRRRRRAGALLAAAAVVVVGGLGIGRLVSSTGGSSNGSADRAVAGSPPSSMLEGSSGTGQDSAPQDETTQSSVPESGTTSMSSKSFQSRITVVVRPEHFADDVASVRAMLGAGTTSAPRTLVDGRVQQCAPVAGRGKVVAVRYGGAVGVLVLRPPTEDTQVVELYICGASDPVRSITLPRH